MPRTFRLHLVALFLLLTVAAFADDKKCAAASLEGKLQTAGPSIYMEGSHELVDSSGKTVARLSGMQNDVDLTTYDGQQVKLTGSWRPTVEAGGKIFEVSGVEPAATTDGAK